MGGVTRFFDRLSTGPQAFAVDVEECVIDAENQDEINACYS